jgi:hypothetical protein
LDVLSADETRQEEVFEGEKRLLREEGPDQRKTAHLQGFRTAFDDMRRVFERRFGAVRYILGDQDTAFEKNFQKSLDRRRIGRFHDETAFKISQVERCA